MKQYTTYNNYYTKSELRLHHLMQTVLIVAVYEELIECLGQLEAVTVNDDGLSER